MRAALLLAVLVVAVAAKQHALVEVPNSAACAKATGECGLVSACTGTGAFIVRGVCAGDASISCCVRSHVDTAPAQPPVTPPTPAPATGLAAINAIADASMCSKRNWNDRGTAPKAYIRGLSQTFAKAVCNPTRPDVAFVGKVELGTNDALSWYGAILAAKLHDKPVAGIATVRQLYTLLAGLGMRESSGQWCVGRDMSASFSSSTTAEAGLYQTSWGANTRSSLLGDLFRSYSASKTGCLAATYKAGVSCSASNLKNWGQPSESGFQWQALTKDCPSFAVEYAAVLLRLNGGSKGEWGPLRTKAAEVVPECYTMFGAVQSYVAANPSICSQLI